MNMRPIGLVSALAALAIALPVHAQSADPNAGTANYLLSHLPNATEALSKKMATEDRLPFGVASNATATDPAGDVLNNAGVQSDLHAAWADATGASWTRDDKNGVWVASATFGAVVPQKPDAQFQVTFYADADGKAENNAPSEGVRGDMDVEWSVKYSDQYGWGVDYRWYNPAPKFWAINKTTKAVPKVEGDNVTLSIPFAELPASWTPRWRVLAVASGTDDTQVDVVPGEGFPAAKNAAPAPKPPVTFPAWAWPLAAAVVVLIALGAYSIIRRKKTS